MYAFAVYFHEAPPNAFNSWPRVVRKSRVRDPAPICGDFDS